jgi:hypothetical protein
MYENRVTISHAPGPPWKTGRSGDTWLKNPPRVL